LPPSQRSLKQGREAELSPLRVQKSSCSGCGSLSCCCSICSCGCCLGYYRSLRFLGYYCRGAQIWRSICRRTHPAPAVFAAVIARAPWAAVGAVRAVATFPAEDAASVRTQVVALPWLVEVAARVTPVSVAVGAARPWRDVVAVVATRTLDPGSAGRALFEERSS
jgi:hypothetical protein